MAKYKGVRVFWHIYGKYMIKRLILAVMKTTYNRLNSRLLALLLVVVCASVLSVNASESKAMLCADYISISSETDIVLEDWMINTECWNNNLFISSQEEDLVLENWMIYNNNDNWSTGSIDDDESEIKSEKWMTDLNKW